MIHVPRSTPSNYVIHKLYVHQKLLAVWRALTGSVNLHLTQDMLEIVGRFLNWMGMHSFVSSHDDPFILR